MQVIAHRVDCTPDVVHPRPRPESQGGGVEARGGEQASRYRAEWAVASGAGMKVPRPDTPPRSSSVHG
jgi:hypothetical protein